MMNDSIVFRGDRLKELRKEKRLSQEELAAELNAVDDPISQTHVSRWERGAFNPLLSTTVRIAHYFGVTVDWLVGESDMRGATSPLREDVTARSNVARAVRAKNGPKPAQ